MGLAPDVDGVGEECGELDEDELLELWSAGGSGAGGSPGGGGCATGTGGAGAVGAGGTLIVGPSG